MQVPERPESKAGETRVQGGAGTGHRKELEVGSPGEIGVWGFFKDSLIEIQFTCHQVTHVKLPFDGGSV